MRVLYLGLWLVTDFFKMYFLCFLHFLIIFLFFFIPVYIAIINHKQFLCLARKNGSLMILQYSYILIIIFIVKENKCKKENIEMIRHLQHTMASCHLQPLVQFHFSFMMCHTDLSVLREGYNHSERGKKKKSLNLNPSNNCRPWPVPDSLLVFTSHPIKNPTKYYFCTLSVPNNNHQWDLPKLIYY